MFVRKNNRRQNYRADDGASIAEFGAAFYAFCIAIMLPTINFVSFALAYSYSYLCANGTADHVAQAISPKRAFQILGESSANVDKDSIAQLLKISARKDPFQLALVKTNEKGDQQAVAHSVRDINKMLTEDDSKNLIQYEITTGYSHQPLLELGSIPFINQIPVIGKETTLTFKMLRHPEHLSENPL